MATFDFIEQGTFGSGFVYKSATKAFGYSIATAVITTGSGTNTVNISSVTSGTILVGQYLVGGTLSGISKIVSFGTFNGTSGTVVLDSIETFANPTTVTASGFAAIVDPDYPATTVRGIVYLDGTYYVMTPNGSIYGSALENPYSWSALNVIRALSEPDGGVCLARQLNLIVAFGTYSTEFFYDAANAVGSPLSSYSSNFLEIGCAHAYSVAQADNDLIFISQGKQRGRQVQVLKGTVPTVISTPQINRILDADPLTSVSAFYISLSGHNFYILGLTNNTLVFDFISGEWAVWTRLLAGTTATITAASWANGLVTATATAHGISDGDYVQITNASPSGYNGNYVVNVIDANTITYAVAVTPGTYVSGGTVQKYTEVPFQISGYTNNGTVDLVQDSTTGSVFAISTNTYLDGSLPIKVKIRTPSITGGDNNFKFYGKINLEGDIDSNIVYVRYSNDDYENWSKYRPVDMSKPRAQLYRLGRARRKAFDLINYDNLPLRLSSLEVTMTKGNS